MKTRFTNSGVMRNLFKLITLTTFLTLTIPNAWGATETGTITFGTNNVKINAASVTGDDDLENTWTITTVGTTSFTTNAAYYQVGSSSKPATSITFTTTLPSTQTITAFSAKFGGFSGTAGTVTLKVGDTSVGTDSLNAANDVTVSATNTTTSGTVLTVTVTEISKGVKCYYISYSYETSGGGVGSTCTVTYDGNGGSGTMTDTNSPYSSGATVTVLDNAFTAPSGYVFDHWNTAADDSGTDYDEGDTFTISANTTLYAQWATPTDYELVTDASDLTEGDKIIILNTGGTYAMSTTQNSNNRGATSSGWTLTDDVVTVTGSSVQVFTLGVENGNWTFFDSDYDSSGGYLYAASSGSNYLRTQKSNDANGQWTISIDALSSEATVTAQGSNTRNLLRYNSASTVFSCYSSGQVAIKIYKEVSSCTSPATALSVSASPSSITTSTSTTLTTAGGNGGTKNWLITSSNSATGSLSANTGNSVTFSASAAGTYTIQVSQAKNTVSGTEYCKQTATIEIVVGSGPEITITDSYVTSTNGQKVKIEVPVTAQYFTSATLTATVTGAGFSFLGWGTNGNSVSSSLTTTAILQYQPTAYNTTNNATLTISATGADNATATIYGRSLPQQFAIVVTNSNKDWAMPANTANSAASRIGLEITTNGTPETVEALPASYVYTLEGVATSRYDNNGIAVRLKGYNTAGYLKAQAANTPDVANQTDAANTDTYEWIITTSDHNTYNITSNNSEIAAARNLRYYDKYFGMYGAGQQSIRLLPIGCSSMPENVTMIPTHNSVTITFIGSAASHTLVIKQGSTTIFSGTVTSGQEITELTPSTDYTYTLTPAGATACAVEGEFSTIAEPITITLHQHGEADQTLSNVTNPYPLPTVADPCDGWTFVGWYNSTYNSTTAPTCLSQATSSGDYYAVYRTSTGSGGTSTQTDVFEYTDFEASSSSYVEFSGVNATSSAVYAGKNAAGNAAIQLRSSNSDAGIVSTTSGGDIKSVTVTWNSQTAEGRTLNIYGNNSAYSSASNLYSPETYGILLGSITYGTSTSLDIQNLGSYAYVGVRSASGALYLDDISFAWTTGATYQYNTTTDCVDCSASGASFILGNTVSKSTENDDFTNTVTYTKTNTSAQVWTSSRTDVATVNATTGLVHIVAIGTTTITCTQALDLGDGDEATVSDNVCALSISYELTVTPPTVEVVEVTADDKIIIESDIDGNAEVIIKEAQTKVAGNVAEDIFISKYYEAASNLKLFAIYNGTQTYIDMSKLRIRSGSGNPCSAWATAKGQFNYLELGSISKLGEDYPSYMLPPFTELIFWSNNYGTGSSVDGNIALRKCVKMTINDNTYDMTDIEEGNVPNWYCVGHYKYYYKDGYEGDDNSLKIPAVDADGNAAFTFNGDDAIILERNVNGTWMAIDIFGAGTSEAPVGTKGDGNGQIQQCSTTYDIQGSTQKLNDSPGGWYWKWSESNTDVPYTTNRAYLTRKKTIKSGTDAVNNNKTEFTTLYSEWECKQVGGENSYCTSGELFSEVGQYNYANYYTEWVNVDNDDFAFVDNGDGTMTVTIENLASHSCNTLRIQITEEGHPENLLAAVDYKVPIMIKTGTKTTTDALFTDFDNAADVCSTCDVVIMNGATLQKVSGGINALRNIEVYAGGTLEVPSGQTLTANQLIMRSKGDVVPRADIQGTLGRYNQTLLLDKRIDAIQWYFFTLPYDCDVADITFRNGDAAVHGTDFLIQYYDGEERAATGTASANSALHYKQFTGTTLKAGVGYEVAVAPKSGHTYSELRFPMKNSDLTKSSTNVSVRAWGGDKTDEELRPNHKGWNMIGNPFLYDYKAGTYNNDPLQLGTLENDPDNPGKYILNTDGAKNIRYVYKPVDGGASGYTPMAVTTTALDPFFSYFVQISGDPSADQQVTFTNTNARPSSIVRRDEFVEEEIDDTPIWVALDLINNKAEQDQTTLLISDRFTDAYDMMDDLVKMRGWNYTRYSLPVLASRNSEGEMAFNALPDVSAKAGVPLTYYAQYDGNYTFRLSDIYDLSDVTEAMLNDTQENRWIDLLNEDYTFSTAKGNFTDRFFLSVTVQRRIKETPTNIDEFNADLSLVVHEHAIHLSGLTNNSMVYLYDMAGKMVTLQNTNGNHLRLMVPADGVYNVRIVSPEGNQTLRAIVK